MEYQYSQLVDADDWTLLAIVPSKPKPQSAIPFSLSSNDSSTNVSLNKAFSPKYQSSLQPSIRRKN